ncbi:hypothetical protein EH220_02975 [bacterium]|nr:MAG: hypothetical protein EH220_02975 [bacterium]
MLIGPIYAVAAKTLKVVLIHLGPGSDQGKAWNYGATTPAWADFDTEAIADFTDTLTEATFDTETWSLYYADIPTAIPSGQRCRAVIIDDADNSHVATIDVGDPGHAAIGEHRAIAPSNVFRLGKRADGTTVAINSICIRPGEIMACAFDVSQLTPSLVASVADLASDDADIVITKLNDESVLGSQAKILVDATVGDDESDYLVTCTITTEAGDVIEAKGTIECRA